MPIANSAIAAAHTPLLIIPPFPGARFGPLTVPARETGGESKTEVSSQPLDVDAAMAAIGKARVGGAYWGAQPTLPDKPYILRRRRHGRAFPEAPETIVNGRVLGLLLWDDRSLSIPGQPGVSIRHTGFLDPWHMLDGAIECHTDAADPLALIAALAGVPVRIGGEGPFAALGYGQNSPAALRDVFRREVVEPFDYIDPFDGMPITLEEAIGLCAYWRKLIDSNRDLAAGLGFAAWKRRSVAPLLWSGGKPLPFRSRAVTVPQGKRLAVWKTKMSAPLAVSITEARVAVAEVEDGFIRSAGLGANCVPPLSITVDRLGVHFDPSAPSELESLLQNGPFPSELLARAKQLREVIVASGLGKYGVSHGQSSRPVGVSRCVLVTGQVEDDRSVQCGGGEVQTNLELLRRARQAEPEAHIIYKPHPDVEAGHRRGAIDNEQCLSLADVIVREQPIGALIDMVDAVHVNTSLAGFEALLRGREVVTHGVPFYAGWGLTHDLGDVPARRTARRSLDELVAAVLLLYPRYLDPVTGLPCPPEVLVRRLTDPFRQAAPSLLVRLRQWQGAARRLASRLRRGE